MIANVLSIAGTDPSGGAGIQADLKAFAAQGAYGMSVITAVVAQNTHGVRDIVALEPDFVAAQLAAVTDDAHVAEQKERYRARRDALRPALEAFDLRIEHSEAGLYLWATADEDCWDTLDRLCAAGILVAPGAFYGAAGRRHVRVALTASDERIAAAAARLTS